MDNIVPLLIIIGLILMNGFFVAAEFSIVGVPRAFIEHLASQGHRVARQISRILHNPLLQDRYIATSQLGITFSSLLLGMYGEKTLAQWIGNALVGLPVPSWMLSHALAIVLAITVLTYFHIVLGEMVPKSVALQSAERTALWITPLMIWVGRLLYPLVIALNSVGNGILRLMNIKRQLTAGNYLTPEELQYIVKESQAGGMLRDEAGRVFQDLLEFGELTAAEVMVPRVKIAGIPINGKPAELSKIILESKHSRYPVYEGDLDHILGMVHIKDLLRLILDGGVLTRGTLRRVPYVPETSTLDTVLAAMRRRRTHLVVVMDEHGGTAGLITIGDLFQEVVGDIEEGVMRPPEASRDELGRLHVSGTMRVDEVGEHLGLTLEHEEVVTVSGLVLMLLDRQPRVGDTVVYDDVQFEVAVVKGHGVGECIVTPLMPPVEAREPEEGEPGLL